MPGTAKVSASSMPICVALSAAGAFLHSLTHLSTFSPFFCTPESPVPIVLSRQTHLSTSTPDSPSARKHQQSRSISLIPAHTHAPRRRILRTSVYIFDHRRDSSARPTSLISINTRTPTLAVLSASTLVSSIQQPSSCRRTPDCRVACRICRIVLHTPEFNKSGAC
jgi:hypothetical protein